MFYILDIFYNDLKRESFRNSAKWIPKYLNAYQTIPQNIWIGLVPWTKCGSLTMPKTPSRPKQMLAAGNTGK